MKEYKSYNQSEIHGVSYIGNPKDCTAMFVTRKVEHLLSSLYPTKNCLVFYETGMDVPDDLNKRHQFVPSVNPQLDYANFVISLSAKQDKADRALKYTLQPEGYYLGQDVVIGENAYIQPNCVIGHHARIGKNAVVLSGTKICHAHIGDDFFANENAVIGANGFTMAKDEDGKIFRIPSLGKVVIENNVEIGTMTNVSRGSAGDTVICSHVKLDAFTHVAHDVYIEDNVEIPAGAVLGGFVHIESGVFVGINSSIRNRIRLGENAVIGMGAVVTKSVSPGAVVVGNPAKPMEKR